MAAVLGNQRSSRYRPVVLRILAILGSAGLVGGVPLLLVEMHATPPLSEMQHLVLHPNQVRDAFASRVSDGAITKLIWSVAWLAWAWFVVCVGVEFVGRVRGRLPGRLPASRHVQWLANCLVGASLAFGIPSRQMAPLRLQVASVPAPDVYGLAQARDPHMLSSSKVPFDSSGMAPALTSVPEAVPDSRDRNYVVKPRDTLWSISENEFGSPLNWRQIAAANYARPQPDGGALTDDHWIRPGWVLVIPALGGAVSTSEASQPVTDDIHVPNNSAMPPSTSRQHGHGTPLENVRNSARTVESLATATPHSGRSRGSSGPHVPILPIGFGLLGAGIVTLLERMRRAQQRLRSEGLRIALPEGDLVELERGLRVGADSGAADWIDLSLRLLSASVRRSHLESPVVSAVLLRDDVVEVILRDPIPFPPSPFEPGSSDNSWVLRKSGRLLEDLRGDGEVVGIDAPLPSLVTLGRDSHGILMINLENTGSLAVSGPEADPLIQAIAVELATAQWSDQIDLVLVGFGDVDHSLERVSHANSLVPVSTKMRRRVQERAALLATMARATNSESRWREGGDSWDLCVVVCSPQVSADELPVLDDLISIAGDGSFGVVVICGRDAVSARWHARTDGGRVSVDGLGLSRSSLSLQSVPQSLMEKVGDLVCVASQTTGVSPDEGPYVHLSLRVPERDTHQWSTTSPVAGGVRSGQPEVVVRILGQVDIRGAARQFTRAWAVELVVYLAVHPGGVSNEQWATALWPEKAMAPASLHSTASAARRSLGTSASGEDHLPRSRGRLALGPRSPHGLGHVCRSLPVTGS